MLIGVLLAGNWSRVTFLNNEVEGILRNLLLIQADITAYNEEHQRLLSQFEIVGPPGIVFIDNNLKKVGTTIVGFVAPDMFLSQLSNMELL